MKKNIYDENLNKCSANFQALSPLQFLERAALAFPKKIAVIHEKNKLTYNEFYSRCRKLASALSNIGIGKGDTVAIISPNTPAMLEAHYGIPMTKAVINTLNYRLDPKGIAYILNHGEAKVLLVDTEFSDLTLEALKLVNRKIFVIDINDDTNKSYNQIGKLEYEDFINTGDSNFNWNMPDDEWDAISLNYTSGTTGDPKGVVYHHRGAYLLAVGNLLAWGMQKHPIYLWTLPMFHCNGWCFPWTISIYMGTHVCLRNVNAQNIFKTIHENNVTHLSGAPIVMNMIANATTEERKTLKNSVEIATAAAPPPAAIIHKIENAGFKVTHLYGLTETYGPSVVNEWNPDWDKFDEKKKSQIKSHQGIRYQTLENLMVADPDTLEPTPADGKTIGEVFFKGNVLMKGYLKNPEATKKAFSMGWFHSGDLGVKHSNGYIELKDRSKDIIISGGENISTIEVENVIYQHPDVLEVAVVAKNDKKWGEIPCAFVTLKKDKKISEEELIEFCRENTAHFKVPKKIVFGTLPKTSTGKTQKFILREKANNL